MTPPNSPSRVLSRAAALWPKTIFARLGPGPDDDRRLSLEAVDALADRHAAHWREAGLGEGARVALAATPEPETLAAMIGATRAGIEVALAPPGLTALALAEGARAAAALALVGPADFAGLDFFSRLRDAAKLMPLAVRLALWGGDRPGAIRLDIAPRLAPDPHEPDAHAGLFLVDGARAKWLECERLQAIAADYVRATRLGSGAAVVSLVSLASLGGLACGAFAPLISGAQLIWQAPFSAGRFAATLEERAPVHLIAPSAVIAVLGRSGLLTSDRIATLTLVGSADFDPLFDHDLEPTQVFCLETGPAARLVRLARAFGGEFE